VFIKRKALQATEEFNKSVLERVNKRVSGGASKLSLAARAGLSFSSVQRCLDEQSPFSSLDTVFRLASIAGAVITVQYPGEEKTVFELSPHISDRERKGRTLRRRAAVGD